VSALRHGDGRIHEERNNQVQSVGHAEGAERGDGEHIRLFGNGHEAALLHGWDLSEEIIVQHIIGRGSLWQPGEEEIGFDLVATFG